MERFTRTILAVVALICLGECAKFRGAAPKYKGEYQESRWVIRKDTPHLSAGYRARLSGIEFEMARNSEHLLREYRVFYGGVAGMEKTMRLSGEGSLFYRVMTDGKRLIKLVYAGDEGLVDCEIEKDKRALDTFLAKFLLVDPDVLSQLRRDRLPIDVGVLISNSDLSAGNVTYRLLDKRLPQEPYRSLADIDTAHDDCIKVHHLIKHRLKAQGVEVDLFGELAHADVKVHDEEPPTDFIPRRVKRVKKAVESRSRVRRDLDLIMPDTMWCGAGSQTENYGDVGLNRGTDMCCREHDHCPYFIGGFSTNYNYFNYYFHTISHCACDEEFRTCLRTVGTSKAELVGELFFDVLGMKCFEFEMEEVCIEHSFWGSCTAYEEQVTAKLRGSLDWD